MRMIFLVDVQPKAARKTSIICTIGPKTKPVEKLVELIDAGMNIVRMNFSHGDYEYHKSVLDNARAAAAARPDKVIAIALDTKGPEIRTGLMLNDTEVPIKKGHQMNITTNDKYATACDGENMYVDYKNLPKVIEVGKNIYVDDGVLSFKVLSKGDDSSALKLKTTVRSVPRRVSTFPRLLSISLLSLRRIRTISVSVLRMVLI